MMPISTIRSDDLPDFENPPLNEVVVGVQFAPPQAYQLIRAGEVWRLFASEFPHVEEHPPIMPAFELFGGPPGPPISLGINVQGALHNRLWFLSPDRDQIIQFQPDRLLHNWRKSLSPSNEYPRFESMIARFEKELTTLEQYFMSLSGERLLCNQCEISYINHSPMTGGDLPNRAGAWLRFLNFGEPEPDDLSGVIRRVVRSESGAPVGRLNCEFVMDTRSLGGLVLTLSIRGAPAGADIATAIDFLKRGRQLLCVEFAAVTTDMAHKIWGRVR